MNKTQFDRTKIIFNDKIDELASKSVAIVGIGGVGGFAVEAIARLGVGNIIIIDKDIVDITNLNRQIIALHSTIGKNKTDVMEQRIKDINPNANVIKLMMFYNEETSHRLFELKPDFVIDACDTITAKKHIIKTCLEKRIKFITSMGAANKLDPTLITISTLDKTKEDKIAKVLRTTLRREKVIGKVPVVYSTERGFKAEIDKNQADVKNRKDLPLLGSVPYIPSIFGLMCASYCAKTLLDDK
ncbi:tRNA threonylcarbamoyladenosine dehydratase [Mycoplasma sp. P36-A1]|uniref:tRNA threonylcarbamoyladenosine dehydratase n=1 Tax=Mycoplasma sp. P36-A1 TaxID=3252900 RepID=UPI003C2DAD2D